MMADKDRTEAQLLEQFTHPRTDLVETPEHFMLLMDLPGVPKEKVDIRVSGGVLSVTGTPQPTIAQKDNVLLSEVDHGAFRRRFKLSDDVVDVDNVTAHLENGVLTMTLPKQKKYRLRRIPVRRLQ
jgi:HSP20 family molecular chaperone IbpA